MNCEHLDLDDDSLDIDDDCLDLDDDCLDLDDDCLDDDCLDLDDDCHDLDDDCLDLDDDCLDLDDNLCGASKAKWRNFIPINPLSFTPSPSFVYTSTVQCQHISIPMFTFIYPYTTRYSI